jgi:hypothetical protein
VNARTGTREKPTTGYNPPIMATTAAGNLVEALAAWDAADARLQLAVADFIRAQQRAHRNGPGPGSYDALQALKLHLAFDRYRVPAAAIATLEKPTR